MQWKQHYNFALLQGGQRVKEAKLSPKSLLLLSYDVWVHNKAMASAINTLESGDGRTIYHSVQITWDKWKKNDFF